MKRTRINSISDKRKKKLQEEAKIVAALLEKCKGHCMICGRFATLEKNHNRKRDRFVLSCRECHSPSGRHRYLDDAEIKELG